MNATQDASAKAIVYLRAVEVAPERYAIPGKNRHGALLYWMTLSEKALIAYHANLEGGPAFSTLNNIVRMPSWWAPEQRFAWRCKHGVGSATCNESIPKRITADLETGAEVPA